MLQDRIAIRYARSMYELAAQQNQVEVLRQDMLRLKELMASSPELQRFLHMPLLDGSRKAAILQTVYAKAGISQQAQDYLRHVTERGREVVLPYIAREFLELYNAQHNITPVQIRSAIPLTAEQRQAIVSKVEGQLKTKAEVHESVDGSLIGGLTVKIGDQLFDGSVATALRRIDKQFTDNPYIEKI